MAFLHTSVKLRFPSLRSRHYTTYSSEQGPGQHKQAADLSICKPTCFLCHPLVTHGKVGGKQHRAQHRHRPAKAGPTKRHLRTRSNIDPQRQGRRSRPRHRPAKAGPTTQAAWSMSPSPTEVGECLHRRYVIAPLNVQARQANNAGKIIMLT